MNHDTATIVFQIPKKNYIADIEIPLYISANELVTALNTAYELGIDTADVKNCYLKAEKPIALLRGNKLLSDFGVRNGTIVFFTE